MASIAETEEVTYGQRMENLKKLCEEGKSLDDFLNEANMLPGDDYVHFRWPNHESILHWAASGGCDDVCEHLIGLGSYVNVQNMHGCNPLFYASIKEHFSTVKLLLEFGADYDCKSTFSGGTPFNPSPISIMGQKKEDSETRIKIKKLIQKYISKREAAMSESAKFEELVSTLSAGRDLIERRLLSTPTSHGSKTGIGYWGLPQCDNKAQFKECYEADKIVNFITVNKENWCRLCTKTSSESLSRCSRCKNVWYCSVDCQKMHWRVHKKTCVKSPK